MGRDYTYLTKLLNGGNMDKHILKDILVSYNTYLWNKIKILKKSKYIKIYKIISHIFIYYYFIE